MLLHIRLYRRLPSNRPLRDRRHDRVSAPEHSVFVLIYFFTVKMNTKINADTILRSCSSLNHMLHNNNPEMCCIYKKGETEKLRKL